MRRCPEALRLVALALGVVLPGCDQLDVTSSVEPPSARCASCHEPEYLSATHPPHAGVKPTTCGTCHTQASFRPARLEHSFTLDGAHEKANCFTCHRGSSPVFEGTPRACSACHAAERARADAEVARHAGFADACATCHTTDAWKPTRDRDMKAAAPELVPPAAGTAPGPAARGPVAPTPTPRAAARPAEPALPHPANTLPLPAPGPPTPTPAPAPTNRRKKADTVSGASTTRGH